MLVGSDLDKVQEKLQDDEKLWSREELLRYYNDGYRQFMSKSAGITRMTILDVPGRFTFTYCFDWEDQAIYGTSVQIMFPFNDYIQCSTYIWEAQQSENLEPTSSQYGVTQLWELAYAVTTDHHFTFALPKSSDHIKRVAWDDELLFPVSVRELDTSDRVWYYAPGQPSYWTAGVGRSNTFEIYEIRTDYSQGYECRNFQYGMPRQMSGSRDYFIYNNTQTEGFFGQEEFGLGEFGGGDVTLTYVAGVIREVLSPERQYLPIADGAGPHEFFGVIRDFKSSVSSVMVTENIIPDRDLTEKDVPYLIPSRMQKYLRYYVLSTAFGKQSEGQRPDLKDHYMMRFNRGVMVMNRLANLTGRDRIYQREDNTEALSRPPRVRLPAHYPQVLF